MNSELQFVSAERMAEILQIDRRGIYALVKGRDIPHLQVGGTYRFDPSAVIQHLTVRPYINGKNTNYIDREDNAQTPQKRPRRGAIDWSNHE